MWEVPIDTLNCLPEIAGAVQGQPDVPELLQHDVRLVLQHLHRVEEDLLQGVGVDALQRQQHLPEAALVLHVALHSLQTTAT